MYLIAIGWMYVVLMMALTEAFSSNGSVLGAVVTFVLYGVLPVSILMYLLGTPARKRARLAALKAAEPEGTPAKAEPQNEPSHEPKLEVSTDDNPMLTPEGLPANGEAAGPELMR